jgi:two-component system LytT family sensor kinase
MTPDPRIHLRFPSSMFPAEPMETQTASSERPSRRIAYGALTAWLIANLLMLGPDFRSAVLPGGRAVTPGVALLLALPSTLVLTAAAWAAFRLTRRYTVARPALARGLAVHAAAALGFSALNVAGRKAVRLLLADPGPGFGADEDPAELLAVVVVYGMIAITAHALEYARRWRERQLAGLRLQASLARAELERTEAELRVLKLQLNPHFLFNSLHAVSALVHDAPGAAERMVVRLADLLRLAATRVGTQEVPLDEEVRTLEPFLEVEAIRMCGRLRVEWAIEPGARDAWVPHMVLQPLVENAIKHGLAGRADGGCVQVAARRRGPWLTLEVRDDGVGLAAAVFNGAEGAGIGTANTRARLEQLYGARHALEIAPGEGGGTRVSLRIPWHQAPLPSRALAVPADAAATPSSPRRRWTGRLAAAAFFLLVWRFGYLGILGQPQPPERIVGATEAAVCAMLSAALLTALFSAAFVLARRTPVVAGAVMRAVVRHARVGVLLAASVAVERNACTIPWGTPPSVPLSLSGVRGMLVETAVWTALFAAASLAAHAVEYARRARASEAAGLRLQASLARARLQRSSAELRGLRMQVNPGFLFTALGAVASRVHHAPADAERMLVRLADLLRQAMRGAGGQEVPLEEELDALEPFLEVERIRLGGRLRVERAVDDEALDALVPHTVLQPLLARAVGREPADDAEVFIGVYARREGEWLRVEVRDAGGAADVDAAEDGGADEVRARLARLYGGACGVQVARMEGGGTRAVVRLPWHDEPWAAPAAPAAREEISAR